MKMVDWMLLMPYKNFLFPFMMHGQVVVLQTHITGKMALVSKMKSQRK